MCEPKRKTYYLALSPVWRARDKRCARVLHHFRPPAMPHTHTHTSVWHNNNCLRRAAMRRWGGGGGFVVGNCYANTIRERFGVSRARPPVPLLRWRPHALTLDIICECPTLCATHTHARIHTHTQTQKRARTRVFIRVHLHTSGW